MFQRFVHSEVAGSVLLMLCAVTALAWANSGWSESYFALAKTYIGVSWGGATFALSLQHWVNDLLMVVFFFVVGLEVKREIVVGELSTLRQAVLPVSAAVGGMVVPAAVYLALNPDGPGARGWGIPMATDIAFALGILAVFGSRVPLGLKVFLTALAIADDIGAVLVIALFYTETIRLGALVVAAVLLLVMMGLVRAGHRRPGTYLLLALGVWVATFASGIHATVAGILVAMVVPVKPRVTPAEFAARAREGLDALGDPGLTRTALLADRDKLDALDDLYVAAAEARPPGISLEHYLHPVLVFAILPLFALLNAGVAVDLGAFSGSDDLILPGIVAGLVLGKLLGVSLFAWLATLTGRAALPEGVRWGQILGVSLLAGVGFTMSLFVSELALDDPALLAKAKLGIIVASLVAGVAGFVVLSRTLPPREAG